MSAGESLDDSGEFNMTCGGLVGDIPKEAIDAWLSGWQEV